MKTYTKTLGKLLKPSQRWVVPVYQRHYEWSIKDDRQLDHLWEDLKGQIEIFIKDRDALIPHYFGAVIISRQQSDFGTIQKNILVDGQQRITTFKLFLIALREVARTLESEKQVSAIENYLYNTEEDEMEDSEKEKYKIWPSHFDRENFQKIIDSENKELRWSFYGCFYGNGKIIKGHAPKILLAYNFLYNELLQYIEKYVEHNPSEKDAQAKIIKTILDAFLNCFQVVLIQLGEGDDPQQIFASLNGLSEPLSSADLLRNDIFHRAVKEGMDVDDLYERKWCGEFENTFWKYELKQGRLKRPRIDHFIGHLVIAETARSVDAKRVSSEYKRYVREKAHQSVEDEIDTLLEYAKTYKVLTYRALSDEFNKNDPLFHLAYVFYKWGISTFHPLVMAIKKRQLDSEIEKKLFHLIESYIVRRTLCGLTTKNYNNVILGLIRAIKAKTNPEKKFLERLFELKGDDARLPSFDEVLEKCKTERIYDVSSSQIRYILSRLEEEKRSKFQEQTSSLEGLSIEHIMPQQWHKHWLLPSGEQATNSHFSFREENLSDEGKEQFDKRVSLIDTIGNLTLVTQPLNSSLSNDSWDKKRGKEGLGQSMLALNKELVEFSEWNEDKIIQRSEDFAHLVKKIWPSDVGID